MTGREVFVQLVNMRDQAGKTHYDRVKLANDLLKDKEWVESPSGGGGDENSALDRLEMECFGDLCGMVSLVNLLELYRNFPNHADWKKHKYDLKKMWAEWRSSQEPQPRRQQREARTRTVRELPSPSHFNEMTESESRKAYEKAYKAVESDAEKITRLEQTNARLVEENTRLKEEVRRLKGIARSMVA